MRKQMEGDQAQRRQRGKAPSAEGATTGASKQWQTSSTTPTTSRRWRPAAAGNSPVIGERTPKPRPRSRTETL